MQLSNLLIPCWITHNCISTVSRDVGVQLYLIISSNHAVQQLQAYSARNTLWLWQLNSAVARHGPHGVWSAVESSDIALQLWWLLRD